MKAALRATHPELAAQLVDQSLADVLTHGSGRKVEWRCFEGHEWTALVKNRSKGTGCPTCAGRAADPIAVTHPDLAAQLVDQTLAEVLSHGSNRKVEWQCSEGHVWITAVFNRTCGNNCPVCAGHTTEPISVTHPDLAAQLVDQTLAEVLSHGSNRKVEWQCSEGHVWKAATFSRARTARKAGCPVCAGYRNFAAPIAVTHPGVAVLLADPSLGGMLTAGSTRRVLWRCPAGHEWESQVRAQTRPSRPGGCPGCRVVRPRR